MGFLKDDLILTNKGQAFNRPSTLSAIGNAAKEGFEGYQQGKEFGQKQSERKGQEEFLKGSNIPDYIKALGPAAGTSAYASMRAAEAASARSSSAAAAQAAREHEYKMDELKLTNSADMEKATKTTLLNIYGNLAVQDAENRSRERTSKQQFSSAEKQQNIANQPSFAQIAQKKESAKKAANAIKQYGPALGLTVNETLFYAEQAESGNADKVFDTLQQRFQEDELGGLEDAITGLKDPGAKAQPETVAPNAPTAPMSNQLFSPNNTEGTY